MRLGDNSSAVQNDAMLLRNLSWALLVMLASGLSACHKQPPAAPPHQRQPNPQGPELYVEAFSSEADLVPPETVLPLRLAVLDPNGQEVWHCDGFRSLLGASGKHITGQPHCPTTGWFQSAGTYTLVGTRKALASEANIEARRSFTADNNLLRVDATFSVGTSASLATTATPAAAEATSGTTSEPAPAPAPAPTPTTTGSNELKGQLRMGQTLMPEPEVQLQAPNPEQPYKLVLTNGTKGRIHPTRDGFFTGSVVRADGSFLGWFRAQAMPIEPGQSETLLCIYRDKTNKPIVFKQGGYFLRLHYRNSPEDPTEEVKQSREVEAVLEVPAKS
jgi:hypothetical protein